MAQLGARVPEDVQPDHEGNVHPKTGGMSAVLDDPRFLPPHFRPRALPGGRSTLPVFALEDHELGAGLEARIEKKHVFVEPAASVALATYQADLCKTRLPWRRYA
jgi:hypothetical protein